LVRVVVQCALVRGVNMRPVLPDFKKLYSQYLQCPAGDNRSYRNVYNMSFVSFSLVVIFFIAKFHKKK